MPLGGIGFGGYGDGWARKPVSSRPANVRSAGGFGAASGPGLPGLGPQPAPHQSGWSEGAPPGGWGRPSGFNQSYTPGPGYLYGQGGGAFNTDNFNTQMQSYMDQMKKWQGMFQKQFGQVQFSPYNPFFVASQKPVVPGTPTEGGNAVS